MSLTMMADMPHNTSTNFIKWDYQEPQLYPPYWFEKLDYDEWKAYSADNWTLCFYVSAAYLAIIFALKQAMKNRPPIKLPWTLFLWNLSLGAFSCMGFYRTGQELLNVLLMPNGLHNSICTRVGLNPPAAFYSVAFALSKVFELGDTVFVVLRKHPLGFLQWYHHSIAVILAWQVLPYSEPIFRYYGVMNYGVHSVMYPYFALKVLNVKISRKVSIMITSAQLLQMVIGVAINVYSVLVISTNGPDACARDPATIKLIGAIYASFVFLFAQFFYQRYLTKKTKSE